MYFIAELVILNLAFFENIFSCSGYFSRRQPWYVATEVATTGKCCKGKFFYVKNRHVKIHLSPTLRNAGLSNLHARLVA
jgi:hypothetical protein